MAGCSCSILTLDGPLGPDTYSVLCHTNLTGITGFRLEALEDPMLPKTPAAQTEGGPGRTPGEGNFTVTHFGVEAATLRQP